MSSPDGPSVAVLLVSHDGARWLPGVLAGLAAQTARPGLVVGVDAGSRDESATLLEGHCHDVVRAGPVGYPEAVRLGLERIALAEHEHEWVWLLHDDSRPDDRALAALLAAAEANPRADLLGAKLREWPSLRRLLEVGVTVTGTARRETGLERGEYDQGQHDDVRRVLACNTAGLLVRRRVLADLGGLEDALPVLGADLDLGWRAAAAGHTTLVVPDAVVFHAEATRRGQRPSAVGTAGRHPLREERRATIFTLLANGSGALLPLRVVRLVLGATLRALGLLLVRAPGEAADEVLGLGAVLAHPGRLRAARAARGRPGRPSGQVAHLLAPFWLPLRHGLDAAGDAAASVGMLATEAAERRRLARFVTSPVSWGVAAVVVLALVACQVALGSVSGGGLSPAPDGRGAWWSLHLESWHALGTGSDVPAPPEVGPLAVVGSVLGPRWTVSLLLLAAVPLALAGAWRLLRTLLDRVQPGTPSWVVALGAAAYGLVPLASGAWGGGRIGPTVAAALLPWAVRAGLALVSPHTETRMRAGWRTGLLLALVVCFAPVIWWLAAALTVLALVAGLVLARGLVAQRTVWQPTLVALVVPLVLLAPWWVAALVRGAGAQLFLEAGRVPSPALDGLDLLRGHVDDGGAPGWAGLVLLGLAVLALLPSATRRAVAGCWAVALVTVAVSLGLSRVDLDLARSTAPVALGGLVVALQVALVVAATLGLAGLARAPRVPRPALVVAGIAVAVVPLAGLATALTTDDDLTSTADRGLPVYLAESAAEAPQHGILVVRGDVDGGLTWTVDRGDGVTLGEDEVLATAEVDGDDEALVAGLLAPSTTGDGARLRDLGVRHVLLPDPADGRLAAVLDATPGLTPTGADPGARAWQVDGDDPPAGSVAGPSAPWRVALLVLQGVALLVVLVLAAPTVHRADPASGRAERSEGVRS